MCILYFRLYPQKIFPLGRAGKILPAREPHPYPHTAPRTLPAPAHRGLIKCQNFITRNRIHSQKLNFWVSKKGNQISSNFQKSLYIWLFVVKGFSYTTSRTEFQFFEQYKFRNAWRSLSKTQKKIVPWAKSSSSSPKSYFFPVQKMTILKKVHALMH